MFDSLELFHNRKQLGEQSLALHSGHSMRPSLERIGNGATEPSWTASGAILQDVTTHTEISVENIKKS